MTSFEVKDMTCGHCVSTITRSVKEVDPDAKVQIDLATHRVTVAPTKANAAELSDAIRQAGYTPIAIDAGVVPAAVSTTPARGGCCCG
jgi:copper chaperone